MTSAFTYGDGVGDIDITKVDRLPQELRFDHHRDCCAAARHGTGPSTIDGYARQRSRRSRRATAAGSTADSSCPSPKILDYIDSDSTLLEREPLEETVCRGRQLTAYKHHGFWRGMDTIWDKIYLNDLWNQGNPPWKRWDD